MRFIKKVPPSAGAPAFKLTLPHQTVRRYFSHLVDTAFELAPSTTSPEAWEGSVAVRRNKQRLEYTLQGWRLFAEAHGVKAGDQMSFELVSPHRLVIRTLTRADKCAPGQGSRPPQAPRQDSPAVSDAPEKQQVAPVDPSDYCKQEEDWLIPTETTFSSPARLMREDASLVADLQPYDALDYDLQPDYEQKEDFPAEAMEHPLQMNVSADSILESSHQVLSSPSENVSTQQSLSYSVTIDEPSGSLSGPSKQNGIQALLDKVCQDAWRSPEAMEASKMPNLIFEAEDSATCGDALADPLGAPLNQRLTEFSARIQRLQTDIHHFESQAGIAEKKVDTIRSMYMGLQKKFDCQLRSALNAAGALEDMTENLAGPDVLYVGGHNCAEKILDIQSNMYKRLALLKDSLWELLILSLDSNA